jgi:hypothetical protein
MMMMEMNIRKRISLKIKYLSSSLIKTIKRLKFGEQSSRKEFYKRNPLSLANGGAEWLRYIHISPTKAYNISPA